MRVIIGIEIDEVAATPNDAQIANLLGGIEKALRGVVYPNNPISYDLAIMEHLETTSKGVVE